MAGSKFSVRIISVCVVLVRLIEDWIYVNANFVIHVNMCKWDPACKMLICNANADIVRLNTVITS